MWPCHWSYKALWLNKEADIGKNVRLQPCLNLSASVILVTTSSTFITRLTTVISTVQQ